MGAELYEQSEIDDVFRAVANLWKEKIEAARAHKKEVFQLAAEEAKSFYNGPRDWDALMGGTTAGRANGAILDEDMPHPSFKMCVNKTFEFVTIFGPAMYSANPVRTCKPRMPIQIPQEFFADPYVYEAEIQQEGLRVQTDGLRALLMESYLNWTPNEFALDKESRLAIDEALILGRGCLWTELYKPPATDFKAVRTTWDTTDHLFVDPDAKSFDSALWVARKCIHPVWQVEKDFGLKPGSLKGNLESQARQADIRTDEEGEYDRRRGQTNDLLIYYKVFSRMGIGGRLNGLMKKYRKPLEVFGDYCYMVIAETCPFLLNLPPDIIADPSLAEDAFARVAWPTPFWADGAFPVSVLDFHPVHNCAWPMPHLKAGIGELKFLNWAYSFLAGKLRNTCRDFLAIKKSAGEELKTAILEGKDLTLIEIEEANHGIAELVQFLQHPQVNGDIWKMLDAVEQLFDKRIGLTELMYGQQGQTQMRSASEANIRSENMSVRPDDMAQCVEAWMAEVAAKEAMACRYHLAWPDIQPAFGPMAAQAWDQYVATRELELVCHQLEYRIESGSTRRPNKDFNVRQMTEAVQTLTPILQPYGQATGDWTPLNNLLADFSKSRDLDPARYQLRAPVPLPTPTADQIGIGSDGSNTENMPPPG